MSQNRELYFKIERLDHTDAFIEEKSVVLLDGDVRVTYDDVNRRTCTFTLAEPLPVNWMSSRWKLYYGQKIAGVINYESLGIFIPLNPVEDEKSNGNYTTRYQGVDKAIILADAYNEIPITYLAGTTLREVAIDILDRIDETKRILIDVPYELATDFTFEEGVSLEHILSTLVRSFPADWYYDRNGFAILEELPVAELRPIKQVFEDSLDSIYVESSKSIDTSKYWNKVTVVGGKLDTGIFRQTYQNDVQIGIAGREITRFFKVDEATSLTQVNDLATQFLDAGTRLPATITIKNFPLVDIEPKQIIMKNNVKYEIISFDIPLGLELQTIQAGEVL